MFLAHRAAAIVNLNSLREIDESEIDFEGDRRIIAAVKTSLQHEIWAVEAILGMSPDD